MRGLGSKGRRLSKRGSAASIDVPMADLLTVIGAKGRGNGILGRTVLRTLMLWEVMAETRLAPIDLGR